MGYTVGVSSGMFITASQDEKSQFLTVPRKIFRGGLEGVRFTQLDIESITEFKEPDLEKETRKIRDLGIEFGVHGESYAMGGGEKPMGWMDSAIETNYEHSHMRLMQHIEGCGMIGAKYVNIHPSETVPFLKLSMSLQPTKLVDPWGRTFKEFFDENKDILDWVIEEGKEFIWEFSRTNAKQRIDFYERRQIQEYYARRRARGEKEELIPEPSYSERKKIEKKAKEQTKDDFIELITTPELAYGAERVAYYLIAKWMMKKRHKLWKDIVGREVTDDDDLPKKHDKWVPAVSSMYIMGHFKPKDTDRFEDPLKKLKENKLVFCFEAQMGTSGLEGLQRLVKPVHMIYLCEAIGSEWVKITIDFEHILSQNLDPREEISEIPRGKAKHIEVLHIGFPTPHTPAHMPVDIGSKEHIYLYEIIFAVRQKGFTDGYLIYERGSAPRGTSILAIKKIKEFLEKDVEPKDLPIDFYGMDKDDFRLRKQQVSMREHALDPLKGLLSIPEEEHTFLSAEAVRKGKADEWRRRRYR